MIGISFVGDDVTVVAGDDINADGVSNDLIGIGVRVLIGRPVMYFPRGRYAIHLPPNVTFAFPDWLTLVFEPGATLVPVAVDEGGAPVSRRYGRVCRNCCRVELSSEGGSPDSLPATRKVTILGRVVAGQTPAFEVDTYLQHCTQRIRKAVPDPETGLPLESALRGRQRTRFRDGTSTRVASLAAVLGPKSNPALYPRWYKGAQANYTEDLTAGAVRRSRWIVRNQTSDGASVDACILSSSPGQVVRFTAEWSTISTYLEPGRTYSGHTGVIKRPPRRLAEPLGVNSSDSEVFSLLNDLKAAYERHIRRSIHATGMGRAYHLGAAEGMMNESLGPGTPLASNRSSGITLANALLVGLLGHIGDGRAHGPGQRPWNRVRGAAQGRARALPANAPIGELREIANDLLKNYRIHIAEREAHTVASEPGSEVGHIPQLGDRSFHTGNLLAESPSVLPPGSGIASEPAAIPVLGFTFEAPIDDLGPYENFQLEHSGFISVAPAPSSEGRSTVHITGCVFHDSPGDGVHVAKGGAAVLNLVRMRDCFRSGLALTGGNSSLAVRTMLSESGARRSGIDIEVETYHSRVIVPMASTGKPPPRYAHPPRLLRRPDCDVCDSHFSAQLQTVYLERFYETSVNPGPSSTRLLDQYSAVSSVDHQSLIVDGLETSLNLDGIAYQARACRVFTGELAGVSRLGGGGSTRNTVSWRRPFEQPPVTFRSTMVTAGHAGLIRAGVATEQPIHEYAGLAILSGSALTVDVSIIDCVFNVENLKAIADVAAADPGPGERLYRRFGRLERDGTPRVAPLFAAARLPSPDYLIAGVWVGDQSLAPAQADKAVKLVRGWVTSEYTVGVLTEQRTRIAVAGSRIDATAGFFWGTGPRGPFQVCLLEADVTRVMVEGSRFALLEGLAARPNAGAIPSGCRISHHDVAVGARSASWAFRVPLQENDPLLVAFTRFTGTRRIIGPLRQSPCYPHQMTDSERLGMPGDLFLSSDPSNGDTVLWVNRNDPQWTSATAFGWVRVVRD